MYQISTSSPNPLAWTLRFDVLEWNLTLQGIYAARMKTSDKWLSKYGLLENVNAKILFTGNVLDFDLKPQLWHVPWGTVSWNES